jgi:hypothetical protein
MANRVLLDYLRILAVAVRGILMNWLTLLPYLLLAILLLGQIYAPLLQDWSSGDESESWISWIQDRFGTRPPFLLTPLVAILVLILFLLFPMVSRGFDVNIHKQSLDGGYIENLGVIELLRRRCKYIITGDGGVDPDLHFGSLATLIRYARIDLGIDIDIDLKQIRLKDLDKDRRGQTHFAIGRIRYPHEAECGYLLYLKSSFTGDEDVVITEYRSRKPAFPHESTADQFLDEDQFEAYRALGQHIGECALAHAPTGEKLNYAELMLWFEALVKALPHRWEHDLDTGINHVH